MLVWWVTPESLYKDQPKRQLILIQLTINKLFIIHQSLKLDQTWETNREQRDPVLEFKSVLTPWGIWDCVILIYWSKSCHHLHHVNRHQIHTFPPEEARWPQVAVSDARPADTRLSWTAMAFTDCRGIFWWKTSLICTSKSPPGEHDWVMDTRTRPRARPLNLLQLKTHQW